MTITPKDKHKQVVEWRTQQFERLGFTHTAALRLGNGTCDWHRVEKTLAAGADHPTAYKIFRD